MSLIASFFDAPSAPVSLSPEEEFGPVYPISTDPNWQWNKRPEMWQVEMLFRAVSDDETNPLRKPFKEALMDIDDRAVEGKKQYEEAIADYRSLAQKYLDSRQLEGAALFDAMKRVFPDAVVVGERPKLKLKMEAFA